MNIRLKKRFTSDSILSLNVVCKSLKYNVINKLESTWLLLCYARQTNNSYTINLRKNLLNFGIRYNE